MMTVATQQDALDQLEAALWRAATAAGLAAVADCFADWISVVDRDMSPARRRDLVLGAECARAASAARRRQLGGRS